MMKYDINLENKKYLYLQIIFVIFAVIIPLSYVFITNHVWEDFFITFKHSKNLAEGNGLVYHPGERVHGFTSVFNTLLPSLFYWITGKTSYLPALWLYRIVSILLYVAAGLYILRYLKKDKDTSNTSLVFFALYYLFLTKTIVFTTNGQEAGFLVFFVFVALLLTYQSVIENWKVIGILWACLMYTRPDGFVYIVAMSLSVLMLTTDDKRPIFICLVKAGLVCGSIFLPWFVFTWLYYGSPVPHTISAKAIYSIHVPKDSIYLLSGAISRAPEVFSKVFLPIYSEFGGWPYWTKVYAFFSGLFCLIYWLLPHNDRFGKYLSLFFTFVLIYLNIMRTIGVIFPWYLTAMELLGILILSRGLYYLANSLFQKYRSALLISVLFNILIFLALTSMFFSTVRQMQVQQHLVENGLRMEIGKWLKENAKPGDSVFLETLGYIGYFSQLKMYDFPGLVSPETVRVCKNNKTRRWDVIVEELEPKWLVLRGSEYNNVFKSKSDTGNYVLAATFDIRQSIKEYKNLQGVGYLMGDSTFIVLIRNSNKSEKQINN